MKSMERAYPLKSPAKISDNLGMTMRDHFASVALPLVFGDLTKYGGEDDLEERMKMSARLAYQFADELMAQKRKEDKS